VLKDRATPDFVLILLHRTARQQVDFTAKNVLDLLVKFKKIPTKMDFGLKRDQQVDIATGVRLSARNRAENFQRRKTA
jgi:hypothetical protein